MEKLTPKHNHTLTDILKVAIFGLILIMPFLVYSPTALYYGFNEHAVSHTTVTEGGYEVTPKYETNEVTTVDDLVKGNIYHFESNTQYTTYFRCTAVYGYRYEDVEATYIIVDTDLYRLLVLPRDNETVFVYTVENSTGNQLASFILLSNFDFVYLSTVNINVLPNISKCENIPLEYIWNDETEVTKDITQMMSQNWQEMWTTPLFNWTNTSILKQGLDNFTGVFGVTDTSCYTNLIAYELIFVAIYIVIDIVLKMFEWLTHMIGNK